MRKGYEYADLYLRVSIDKVGKYSIERQESDCRGWVDQQGLRVRQVHVDRGSSGYVDGAGRTGLSAAIAAVSSGVVATLVVWKLDRLSRQGIGKVGELLEGIHAAGGRLVSVQDALDTSEPADRRLVEMLSELAWSESANLGLRVRSAKQYLRSRGRWIGGPPPYGLAIDHGQLAVDLRTGPVVRQIADRILAGASLIEVARWLNDAGIPSPRGGLWGSGSISQLVRSPSVAGLLPETQKNERGQYTNTVTPWRDPDTGVPVSIMAPGQQPLISPSEQQRIITLFDERTTMSRYGVRRGRRASDSQYLLTGLLRCASCGGRMSKQGNSYRCQTVRLGRPCDAPGGAYRPALDDAVLQIWANRLTSLHDGDPLLTEVVRRLSEAADPEAAMRRSAICAALTDDRKSLRGLDEDHYVNQIIDRDRYLAVSAALSRRIDDLSRSLLAIPLPSVDVGWLRSADRLREKWAAAGTVSEQRNLLKLAILEVRVTRGEQGCRFRPGERLTVRWVV